MSVFCCFLFLFKCKELEVITPIFTMKKKKLSKLIIHDFSWVYSRIEITEQTARLKSGEVVITGSHTEAHVLEAEVTGP